MIVFTQMCTSRENIDGNAKCDGDDRGICLAGGLLFMSLGVAFGGGLGWAGWWVFKACVCVCVCVCVYV